MADRGTGDPVGEADFNAYIDDALDLARRIEVEDHLARHPDAAARVMADLRARDELRAAMMQGRLGPPPERTVGLARRLDRSLAWRRAGLRLRRVAAVAVLVGAGWLARSEAGFSEGDRSGPETAGRRPSIVEDALQARDAASVRARMVSQRSAPLYDPADIRAATGIELPELPRDWRVRDVQVFPGRGGQGVEVTIDAGTLGPLSLFAARAAGDAAGPEVVRAPQNVTVHWRGRSAAYALTGAGDEPALGTAAARMAGTLR